MKKNLIFVAILLLIICGAYATQSLLSIIEVNVKYDGSSVADDKFFASILRCHNQTIELKNRFNITQLDISEFDSKKSCSWTTYTPFDSECNESKCRLSSLRLLASGEHLKLAIFIPSINKTFISGEITMPSDATVNYDANLRPDGIIAVRQTGGSNLTFWRSVIFPPLILWVVSIFSFIKLTGKFFQNRKRILLSAIFSVVLSAVAFVFFIRFMTSITNIIAVLIALFAISTTAIRLLNKEILDWKHSSLLGITAFLFLLGILLLFVTSLGIP